MLESTVNVMPASWIPAPSLCFPWLAKLFWAVARAVEYEFPNWKKTFQWGCESWDRILTFTVVPFLWQMKSKVLVQKGAGGAGGGRVDHESINRASWWGGRSTPSWVALARLQPADPGRGLIPDVALGFPFRDPASYLGLPVEGRHPQTGRSGVEVRTWDGALSSGGSPSLDTAPKQPAVSAALTLLGAGLDQRPPTPLPPAWVALWCVHCNWGSPDTKINYYIGNKDIIHVSNMGQCRGVWGSTARSVLSGQNRVHSWHPRESSRKNNIAEDLCCTDLPIPGKAGAAGATSAPSKGIPSVWRVYSAA